MEFQGKKSNGICEMIEFKGDTNDTPNTILGNWQHDVAIYFNSENVSKFGEEIIIFNSRCRAVGCIYLFKALGKDLS